MALETARHRDLNKLSKADNDLFNVYVNSTHDEGKEIAEILYSNETINLFEATRIWMES